ncbi:MAG TPA: N-acetylneuraminate synthase family protein, partial [Vicinamibacteria bacterium]|nr:N-acetylneuraminate synthase family protein [Vicinamibacteria bacterium]
ADGVKFQLFRAADLIAPNDPRISTFQQIELSLEDWDEVLTESRSLGLSLFGEVFDRESLTLAERHDLAAYKIHSTDLENPEFIRAVAAAGRPLLLATGGSGLGAIEAAIEVARTEGNEKLMLLHGVQNFPTRIEDSNLRYIATLRSTFGLPVGFLDHVDGGTPMAVALPALAVSFGADLVEKHITLDRTAKGFDYESALEKEAFASMVELIRESEKAFGSTKLPSGASASRYHRLMRRAVLSRVELKKGEPLTRDRIAFLRCETGLPPYDAPRLLGRKPRRDIAPWEPLSEDLFE